MYFKKKLTNYFLLLIILSFFIYFFWLIKLISDFPWRYVFTDWIINYKGGYIRRGLLGEISVNLSTFLNINIKTIFFLIHLFIYLVFHILFYKFFLNFKRNYLFYFFCFSPLVFLYPIATFEALARKEIFYITLFLLNCYFLNKIKKRNPAFILTNTCFIISYLIHESSFIFFIFFYLTYYVFLKKNNFQIKFQENLIIIIIIFILFYLLSIAVTETKILKMTSFISENFYLITKNSGAVSALGYNLSGLNLFLKHNNISLKYIFQYILLLHFLIIFLYILYNNVLSKFGKFFYLLSFGCFFSPIILFLIASDWGRFVYILYNFCLIFTFFCLYNDKKIFEKIDKFSILQKLNTKFKIFFTFCYISMWSPKIWFFEDIEVFPLFKVFFDIIKYSLKYTLIFFKF